MLTYLLLKATGHLFTPAASKGASQGVKLDPVALYNQAAAICWQRTRICLSLPAFYVVGRGQGAIAAICGCQDNLFGVLCLLK
jgi:hypothetical protein